MEKLISIDCINHLNGTLELFFSILVYHSSGKHLPECIGLRLRSQILGNARLACINLNFKGLELKLQSTVILSTAKGGTELFFR